MPKAVVHYDHVPTEDEPTIADVSYSDLDQDTLVGMAMNGDQGAVDYLNAQGDELGAIKSAEDLAKGHEDTPNKVEDTQRLMTYWAEGEGAAKIGWGVDGDFDRCRVELGKYVKPEQLDGLCANLHHRATGAWPGHAPGESDGHHHKATTIVASGLIVKADDTGRVLMVQRSIDNDGKTAGQWEFPGGKLEDGEDSLESAKREFFEETGIELPKGKIAGSWTTSTGYQCFVYLIKHEASVELENGRSSLDGTGDGEIENVAWWTISDLQNNSAVRPEIQASDWAMLGSAKIKKSADDEAVIDYSGRAVFTEPLKAGDKVIVKRSAQGFAQGDWANLRDDGTW